ncbi:MAG: bifunctional phosphoglucose/phosphomannose isomerase [Patescibacteria group bacterium]
MYGLDDEGIYTEHDPRGMRGLIEGFPRQAEDAWRIGRGVKLPGDYARAENLVIQGMGGSAIGGDLLCALYRDTMRFPAVIVRQYDLPAFAGPGTLFVASSYSGNTEETLAGYEEAKRRGCKILAMASGGLLAARAGADGFPLITIPGGLSPRAALGYSFFPLLAALGALGLVPDPERDFHEALAVLGEGAERYAHSVPAKRNPPKQLALLLRDRYPLIYAAGSWPGIVAMRWKGQLNENAKHLASYNVLPELNHNETVGFEHPAELVKRLGVVFLHSGDESAKLKKRIEATRAIVTRAGAESREVAAAGKSALARMFSLIQHGDFVSLYLAMLNRADPTPVQAIDWLKRELETIEAAPGAGG